jgi:hypothetical protein
MEGYIHVKLKFSQTRCWAILDSQQLTYYSHLDLVEQVPKGFKGVVHTKKATFSKFNERGIQHGITIDSNKTLFSFDCLDAATCSAWFNALTRSSNENEEDSTLLVQQWRGILGVDLCAKLTKSEIARSYKKLCLKEHPDKGGNVDNFNKINSAYNSLIALQANIDERDSCDVIHYEAVVEKGKDGGGLGIVVAEDKSRKQVIVQRVEPFCLVVGLTEEADGEIRSGDAVIGIDRDDCSHWYLSRIRARLGPFRAPGGTQIHFTFERRVPKAELMSEDMDNTPRKTNARFDDSPQPTPREEERSTQLDEHTTNNSHSQSQQQTQRVTEPAHNHAGEEPVLSEAEAKKAAFKARRQQNTTNNGDPVSTDTSPLPTSDTTNHVTSDFNKKHTKFSEDSIPSTPVPLRLHVPDKNTHYDPYQQQQQQQPSMHQIDAFSPVLSPINDLNRTSDHGGVYTPLDSIQKKGGGGMGRRNRWDIFESVVADDEASSVDIPQRGESRDRSERDQSEEGLSDELARELEATRDELERFVYIFNIMCKCLFDCQIVHHHLQIPGAHRVSGVRRDLSARPAAEGQSDSGAERHTGGATEGRQRVSQHQTRGHGGSVTCCGLRGDLIEIIYFIAD